MWMDILCMLCLGKEKFKYFIFTPNRTIQYIAQEWRSIYLEHDDMIYRIFVSKTRKISALVKTIIYIRHIFFYLDHQLMTLIQILSTALVHSFKKGRNLWMYCCSTHLWILNHPEKIPWKYFIYTCHLYLKQKSKSSLWDLSMLEVALHSHTITGTCSETM